MPSRQIVGTYRLQTGRNAAFSHGYYCAQEFGFHPFEPFRAEMVELGRACVHRQHRNLVVLGLLWKGIAEYARDHKARYLFSCSSITSQDPAVGASSYADLGLISYQLADGEVSEEICYWKDMTLASHLINVLSKRCIRSCVKFTQVRQGNANRKELARRLHSEVMQLRCASTTSAA